MENTCLYPVKPPERLTKNYYENRYWEQDALVCGIDEAGRGPLAGPVVAAAVIVPKGTTYRLLKDSKLMTAEERQKAFAWIRKQCVWGVGVASAATIDRLNIWGATQWAMRRALMQLMSVAPTKPAACLIDAMPLPLTTTAYATLPTYSFPYGEKRSCSIAAASIVAKETRDAIMNQMGACFPLYGFDQHKGYGTVHHRERITQHNRSLVHRTQYVASMLNRISDETHQQTLF